MGEEWRALDAEHRAQYVRIANQDRQREEAERKAREAQPPDRDNELTALKERLCRNDSDETESDHSLTPLLHQDADP